MDTRDQRAPLPLYLDDRIAAASGIDDQATLLRWLLDDAGAVSVSSVDDLEGLGPGALVDLTAAAFGNPLLTLLDFVAPTIPLVLDATSPPSRVSPRAGAPRAASVPAGGPDAGGASPEEQRVLAGLVAMAREGMHTSPVVDMILITADELPVVAVLDRVAAGPATEAFLQDGTYQVLGKVMSVLGADEEINLFRRSLLAALGSAASSELLEQAKEAGSDLEIVDPVLSGPLLEVLPVAILA